MIIVLCISLMFSLFLYRQVNQEIKRSLRIHSQRLNPGVQFMQPFNPKDTNAFLFAVDLEIYEELQKRIVYQLLLVNSLILGISALTSYFLAGKTLYPIELMWEEQKRFVADASHELRTPLTSLKTEIEVALRDKKLTTLQYKQILESNLEEVNRMHRLSNYLLTLNNFDDSGQIDKTLSSLKMIIDKSISQLQANAQDKNIVINNEIHDLKVYGNADLLIELFSILIDNSIKYSKSHTQITIVNNSNYKSVQISIKDQGIGIKASDLPYIFNRFYRSDTSRSKLNVEGYGLGLSIAKQIVEAHNGSIAAQSKINKGAVFTVSLPIHS